MDRIDNDASLRGGSSIELVTVSNPDSDSNKQLLDETWEAKLEAAKPNFRNNSNLSHEQKSALELKYEAIQSKLRQLGSLRGNPQAYRQAQEEATSLAIGFGVDNLPK